MRISRSLFFFAFSAGIVAVSSAFSQTTEEAFSEQLGSCAKQVDSQGKRLMSDLYVFAITTGKLSYEAALKVQSTQTGENHSPFCTEVANDPTCGRAQITIDCIEGPNQTSDTASMALKDIATIEAVFPYIVSDDNGELSIVPVNDASGTHPTKAELEAFQALRASLGTGPLFNSARSLTLAEMKVLAAEIALDSLKYKLRLEASTDPSVDGTYTSCLRQKIAAKTCGSASDLGAPANSTGAGNDATGEAAQTSSETNALFEENANATSAATKFSISAWKSAQTLSTSGNTASVRNFASGAQQYSSLSRRIRTAMRGATGSKTPLPVTRGMGSTTPTDSTKPTQPLDGTLTEDQIQDGAEFRPATCFSSSKLRADFDFYKDKPAFRGSRTLHLYEILHAGSEATNTDLNPQDTSGPHAILTSPYRVLVPSLKMEDTKNKEMKAAGLATVYHPFVRLRGFCPAGATKVNIGGSSAPRIVTSVSGVATNSYQISNDVNCVADGKYKIFDAIVVFTGKPGLHLLELKADNIGTGGGSLSCKEEIYVAGETDKSTYATFLTKSDYTNHPDLLKFPHIRESLSLNPATGAP